MEPSQSKQHKHRPNSHPPPVPDDHHHSTVHCLDLRLFPPTVSRRLCAVFGASLLLLTAIGYAAWPSIPDIQVVQVRLNRIRVRTAPTLRIDVTLLVKVKVVNPDMFSLEYEALDVAVGYRGKALGHVRSQHGQVRALGSSYIDASVDLDGVEVLNDAVLLLKDLAKGTVPLDTVTLVEGRVGVLFFGFSIKVMAGWT